jgi:transcriptional regulator with XRE-family HTH domain
MKDWQNSELIKRFGAYFKKLRTELGLTQKNIAVKAKMEQSHVSEIEAGLRNITLDIIFSLAKAMDIGPQRFFAFLDTEAYNIRHSQSNEKIVCGKEKHLQATADGFPKKEMSFQPVSEGFPEMEISLEMIRNEYPELEELNQ